MRLRAISEVCVMCVSTTRCYVEEGRGAVEFKAVSALAVEENGSRMNRRF